MGGVYLFILDFREALKNDTIEHFPDEFSPDIGILIHILGLFSKNVLFSDKFQHQCSFKSSLN